MVQLNNIYQEFYNYGKNIGQVRKYTKFTVIPFIGTIFALLSFIATLKSLKNLYNANKQLKNEFISKYLSKFIIIVIMRTIGSIIILIGAIQAVITLILLIISVKVMFYESLFSFIISFIYIFIGWCLKLISAYIEGRAWEQLIFFLVQDGAKLFPNFHKERVIKGCEDLVYAAHMYTLSFLVNSLFTSYIFKLKGYLKLAEFSKLNDISNKIPK